MLNTAMERKHCPWCPPVCQKMPEAFDNLGKILKKIWKCSTGLEGSRGQRIDFNLASTVETGSHLVGCNGFNGFKRVGQTLTLKIVEDSQTILKTVEKLTDVVAATATTHQKLGNSTNQYWPLVALVFSGSSQRLWQQYEMVVLVRCETT